MDKTTHSEWTLEISTETRDSDWDAFLERSHQGHFQQSSAWAAYKASEGWNIIRAVFANAEQIVGGFQILWKVKKRIRIGYISKGPVVDTPNNQLLEHTIASIKETARKYKIAALIVQPADDAPASLVEGLNRARLAPCNFLGIIDSTLLVDLSVDTSIREGRYRSSTRKKRNKAIRSGLTIREGDEQDIPEFFRLMLITCERQGEQPNPSTESSIRALWDSLNADRRRAYLKFTIYKEEVVSGDLIIVFGKRLTLFKTGWTGQHGQLHPNILRVCETLNWASSQNCLIADFAGFDRNLAETLLAESKLSQLQCQSRDYFKSGFGGYPKLLPEARVWISNPFYRFCYRTAVALPFVRNKLKQIVN